MEEPAHNNPPSSLPNVIRRLSSRRRSKDIPTRAGATPLVYNVREDDYDDPPPPSAIRTYRENKSKQNGAKRKPPPVMSSPLLSASFADTPSPLSSPDASGIPPAIPQYALAAMHPEWAPQQGLMAPSLTPPLPTPGTESTHPDSFLERAFAAPVEPSSSVEVLSAGTSSSQSHHNHVKLGPHPEVAMKMKALPQTPLIHGSAATAGPSVPRTATSSIPLTSPRGARVPQVVRAPDVPRGQTRSSHRRDSAQFSSRAAPDLRTSPPPQAYSPQSPPRLQRAELAYSRGAPRRNSAAPQYTPPPNRFVPTRERIVLPAPLASSPSPARQVFASPRYSPPGLPTSALPPSSRNRRWTAPHPDPNMSPPR